MISAHESADAQGNWSLCMLWDKTQKTLIWFLSSVQKKHEFKNNLSKFATCIKYYELVLFLMEWDTFFFDQIGSWSGFRFQDFAKSYVSLWIFGAAEIKMLLADRQTFRIIFAIISPWRKVSKNLWMHMSLGRRNNHATILRKCSYFLVFVLEFCMLWSIDARSDGHRTRTPTDGQRTDMNEGGSLYMRHSLFKNRLNEIWKIINFRDCFCLWNFALLNMVKSYAVYSKMHLVLY